MADNRTSTTTTTTARRGPGMGGGRGRGGRMIIAKPKDFRGTFRKLLRFMRPHWMGMTAIILLAGATTLASSLSPKIMGSATNEIVRGAQSLLEGGSGVDFGLLARILMLLLERGTVLTCAEISHLLKVSNSAVSNAVRSLSRVKHYVEREKVAGSGKIKVQLTEEGVSTAQEIRERFITRYMKQFDVTREEFEEVLKAVHPRHRKSYMQKVFGESFAGI